MSEGEYYGEDMPGGQAEIQHHEDHAQRLQSYAQAKAAAWAEVRQAYQWIRAARSSGDPEEKARANEAHRAALQRVRDGGFDVVNDM